MNKEISQIREIVLRYDEVLLSKASKVAIDEISEKMGIVYN